MYAQCIHCYMYLSRVVMFVVSCAVQDGSKMHVQKTHSVRDNVC